MSGGGEFRSLDDRTAPTRGSDALDEIVLVGGNASGKESTLSGSLGADVPGASSRSFLSRNGRNIGIGAAAALFAIIVVAIVASSAHHGHGHGDGNGDGGGSPSDGRWPGRLPLGIVPVTEKVSLRVDMDGFTFGGTAEIVVKGDPDALKTGGDGDDEDGKDDASVKPQKIKGLAGDRARGARDMGGRRDKSDDDDDDDKDDDDHLDEAFDQIVVHAGPNLSIEAVSVDGVSLNMAEDVERVAEYDFVKIRLRGTDAEGTSKSLRGGGSATVSIRYSAELSDKLGGFYRSEYDEGGAKHWIAVTDFEPVDARTAFPCFDEPALKAKFTIEIETQDAYTAMSNMPVASKGPADTAGRTAWAFEETPPMSTYLVCFSVNEFRSVKGRTAKGVNLEVWGQPSKVDQLSFALEVANFTLGWYEERFGIAFPLPKLSLLAVPNFEAGAMENWGLVTFREIALLVDDAASSPADRQYVAIVIAHELAHMWFGDLVTPLWWMYIWLNESFAAYMEALSVAAMHPEWGLPDQFLTENVVPAMRADGFTHTHPIQGDIVTPADIRSAFDSISYEKGASVLRMLRVTLGDAVFFGGIHDYLASHAYGTATTEGLFAALTAKSRLASRPGEEIDVEKLMDAFIHSPGYPAVAVTAAAGSRLVARQSSFSYTAQPAERADATWRIPLTFAVGERSDRVIFSDRAVTLADAWGGACATSTVRANLEHVAYAAVVYSPQLLACLLPRLDASRPDAIPSADRAALIADMARVTYRGPASVPAGEGDGEGEDSVTVTVATLMDTLSHLSTETDLSVWRVSASALSRLMFLADRAADADGAGDVSASLREFSRAAVSASSARLGWAALSPGVPHMDALLRPTVQRLAVSAGDTDALSSARALWAARETSPVPADLRRAVYRVGAAEPGGAADLEAMYTNAGSAAEEINCLYGLAGAPAGPARAHVLEMTTNGAVRDQDLGHVLQWMAGESADAVESVVDHIISNWDYLTERYPARQLINRILPQVVDAGLRERVVTFFTGKGFISSSGEPSSLDLGRALEAMDANAAWIASSLRPLKDWLAAHNN